MNICHIANNTDNILEVPILGEIYLSPNFYVFLIKYYRLYQSYLKQF